MTNSLALKFDDQLRLLPLQTTQIVTVLAQSLARRPDMEYAVRCLMSPDNILETFNQLAGNGCNWILRSMKWQIMLCF